MYYAGIGSRETPEVVLDRMVRWGRILQQRGLTLRSGGAPGADLAFEKDVTKKQIFVPYLGFNGCQHGIEPFQDFSDYYDAHRIAEKFHPNWKACSVGARRLHLRNVAQVLGPDLSTHSKFILCWTIDGMAGGGTGQAIRIAHGYDIPVFDMALMNDKAVAVSIEMILGNSDE